MSPDFATLYSFNANASISRELGSGFVVSGSYLYTKGTHLPVYRNINLVPSGAYLADGRPIFSTSARVYQGFNNILSAESVGNSNYNALNMTLQKRCGRACQLYATYTWSHAIDDAPEQNNIDSSNFLSDPTNRRRDRANSLTDKRHVFNMTGVFLPEFHVSARFREPDPQRQPAFVDNPGGQRRPVQHRQQPAIEPGLFGTSGVSAPTIRWPEHIPRPGSVRIERPLFTVLSDRRAVRPGIPRGDNERHEYAQCGGSQLHRIG